MTTQQSEEMIKSIEILPYGFKCKLGECPSGLFLFGNTLCFANDYNEYFIVENGDALWGGTTSKEERDQLIVQPMVYEVQNAND